MMENFKHQGNKKIAKLFQKILHQLFPYPNKWV